MPTFSLSSRWWLPLLSLFMVSSLRAELTIQSIPNQLLYQGAPPLRVPVIVTGAEGDLQVTASVAGRRSPIQIVVETIAERQALRLRATDQLPSMGGRASVTVTAASGGISRSVNFFVIVRQRDFASADQVLDAGLWRNFGVTLTSLSAAFGWADLNGDGFPDLAIPGANGVQMNPAGVSLNRTIPFGFQANPNNPAGSKSVIWGDVDGDGDPDAFVYGSPRMGIYRTSRISGPSPALILITNQLERIAVEGATFADVDCNGSLDLVYSGVTNGLRRVITALNDGQGIFTIVPNDLPSVAGPVLASDFDGDGRVDLMLGDSSVPLHRAQIFWNRSPGPFEAGPIVSDALPVTGAGVVDANGDGVPDVWLVQSVDDRRRSLELNLFLQKNGRFEHGFGLPTNQFAGAAEPVWGDFDHDGRIDLVAPAEERVLNALLREVGTNYFTLYHGTGEGGFRAGGYLFGIPPHPAHLSPTFIPAAADVDLDGDLDIVGYDGRFYSPYYNLQREVNLPPGVPSGLRGFLVGEDLFLFWSAAFDANQTAPLTYNVRVGSSPGGNDLVPSHSLADGTRMLPVAGNAGFSKFFAIHLSRRDLDGIHWSVQAVDAGGAGGPFAAGQFIAVDLSGNRSPEIAGVAEFTMLEDSVRSLVLGLSDDRTPAALVELRVTSDSPQIFEPQSLTPITLENDGTGSRRRINLTPLPDANGVATLTLIATDRNRASTTNEIRVTVQPVNDPPEIIVGVPDPQFQGLPVAVRFRVQDRETVAEALTVSVRSSNQEVLPDGQVQIRGEGPERELIASPIAGRTGRTVVTLTVRDTEGLPASAEMVMLWQNELLTPMESPVSELSLAHWVDFDGDGRLDVVGLLPNQGVIVSFQSAEGDFVHSTAVVPGAETRDLELGDFDGDGDVDVVTVGGPGFLGTVTLLPNDNGKLGQVRTLSNDNTIQRVVAMDADADGDLDLLALRHLGELVLWRQSNDGSPGGGEEAWQPLPLTQSGTLFGPAELTALLSGDVDGDGRKDIILSQQGAAGRLLIQMPDGRFADRQTPWSPGARVVDWTDFDLDGYPDALLEVQGEIGPVVKVRLGSPQLAGLVTLPLKGVSPGLGDLDFDGYEDVLGFSEDGRGPGMLSQLGSRMPRFTPQWSELPVTNRVASGDFDQDGRLDLLVPQGPGSLLFRNLSVSSNRPPSPPGGLNFQLVDQGVVELTWAPSTDAEQSGGLTYNVRVGTAPGRNDVVSAQALPDGRAMVPGRGNAGWIQRFRLTHLTIGDTYYWSVQAVDSGFARSPFAAEATFTVSGVPVISPIADHSIPLNSGAQDILFTVWDLETPADDLTLAVTSSNPVLLPASRLSLSGSGTNRVLRLATKPDRAGSAELTLRVTDGSSVTATRVFTVYVPSALPYAVEPHLLFEVAAGVATPLKLDSFDPDGDFLSYQVIGVPGHGSLNGQGPDLEYTPQAGFFGDDGFRFMASTPGSSPASGRVTIQVVPAYRLRPEIRLTQVGHASPMRLVVRGRAGSTVRTEHSRDLVTWDLMVEQRVPDNEVLVLDPSVPDDAFPHFYRTVRTD